MFTQTTAALTWLLASLPPLVASVVYFRMSAPETSRAQRLLVSAHGVAITGLCVGAVLIGMLGFHNPAYRTPFTVFCLVAFGLMVYGVVRFRGKRLAHLSQLINAIWLLLACVLGGMAVSGAWL